MTAPSLAVALWQVWPLEVPWHTLGPMPFRIADLWPVSKSHMQWHELGMVPSLAAARWRASPFPMYKLALPLMPSKAVKVCLSISESNGDVVEHEVSGLQHWCLASSKHKNHFLVFTWCWVWIWFSMVWWLTEPWLSIFAWPNFRWTLQDSVPSLSRSHSCRVLAPES